MVAQPLESHQLLLCLLLTTALIIASAVKFLGLPVSTLPLLKPE